MIEIAKPHKHLPFFVILNYKEMLSADYRNMVNMIVLNGKSTDELIENFSKDMRKSSRFIYWLCFHNSLECLEGALKLVKFMHDNEFSFTLTGKQLEMYLKTLDEANQE